MEKRTLYLPSTPLNLLVSVAHALRFRDSQRAWLCLIDQKTADSPYASVLKRWDDSPFESVEVLCQPTKSESKRDARKAVFASLKQMVMNVQPTRIGVGSDRRVEFQYAMHQASRFDGRDAVTGFYLDDGLYSYAGRPYKWYKDKINSLLKKLAYGFWWEEPTTVGASSWIDEAWLFESKKAVSEITRGKKVCSIEQEWFVAEQVKQFSSSVLKAFDFDAKLLSEVDMLVFIPHPNNVLKMRGYEQNLKASISTLKAQKKRIAVKYHPRVEEEDFFSLRALGVEVIVPAKLASEFVLPALKRECYVVGDVGTALLTVRWIRPELEVFSILSESDPFQNKFVGLMHAMGVHVVKSIGEVVQ